MLITATYAPVGARSSRDKAPFGRTILALEADPENPAVAAAADGIARELLARPGSSIAPFVAALDAPLRPPCVPA